MPWFFRDGSLFPFWSYRSLGCCGPRIPHGSDLSPSRFLVGLIKSLCKVSHIFIFLFYVYTHVAGITCSIRLTPLSLASSALFVSMACAGSNAGEWKGRTILIQTIKKILNIRTTNLLKRSFSRVKYMIFFFCYIVFDEG